jgi:hypothetical protein
MATQSLGAAAPDSEITQVGEVVVAEIAWTQTQCDLTSRRIKEREQ